MSEKEANRLSIMQQMEKKQLTTKEACAELNLSLRQTKRLKRSYLKEGAKGLISRRRGRPNCRRLPDVFKEECLNILRDPMCEGWGPTFATEKLLQLHQKKVSRETLRGWMIEAGLWKSKTSKKTKIYQRRTRRSKFGELIQGDGSHHDWFEGRGEKCALLVFVDDATSIIPSAKFFPTETTEGYLDVLEAHLQKHGRPGSLYVDKHSVFRVNREDIQKGTAETHFGKVLRKLDIGLICAHSPQAKGRVERANSTLQDRLVKEMRLRGIKNIEEANAFLPEFIEKYNSQFGKEPKESQDAHRQLRESDNLERIFARKETRRLSKNLTFQFQGTLYQLKTKTPNRIRKMHVEVYFRPNRPLEVEIEGRAYEYTTWEDVAYRRAPVLDAKQLEAQWKTPYRRPPSKRHPWK